MYGRQYVPNLERKGPHKSMHCKFCKPPGVVTPEKPSRPTLETKTKFHLTHEAADLLLSEVHDEPGLPIIESEACICVLEGDSPCPKCVPDKNRIPAKKKTCRCLKGAKPHSSMLDSTTPKRKKKKEESDEFWWEKHGREHDIIAKETWSAYMIQRRKEKKLYKTQSLERQKILTQTKNLHPFWFQKLSIQQIIYVEFLAKAIRLDSDENITDRTSFVLAGLGLYPRPKKKLIEKCIKYGNFLLTTLIFNTNKKKLRAILPNKHKQVINHSLGIKMVTDDVQQGMKDQLSKLRENIDNILMYSHYNAIQFLNQFLLLTKDSDPFGEKKPSGNEWNSCTWNDRLIMSSLCHLELPALLREIMDRLPPLRRDKILPPIPYPVFPQPPQKEYHNPYEEPLWKDCIDWPDKNRIDRINRWRAHMNNKRVKIPCLALVRRPSLIDARPAFMAEFEAKGVDSKRKEKKKQMKVVRKHLKHKFDSDIDVTAIAEIEVSEVSATDKADLDDLCVFLREPTKDSELTGEGGGEEEGEKEEEMEEEAVEDDNIEVILHKEHKFAQEEHETPGIDNNLKLSESDELMPEEDIPFVTPPKTKSGTTIVQPCDPPKSSPAPPALHYYQGKRQLDVVNEEICGFHPFVTCSTQTIEPGEEENNIEDETTSMLVSAAQKLQELAEWQEKEVLKKKASRKLKLNKKRETEKKISENYDKKDKQKRGHAVKKSKKNLSRSHHSNKSGHVAPKEKDSEKKIREKNEKKKEEEEAEVEDFEEEDEIMEVEKNIVKPIIRKSESEISDPDPKSEDDLSAKFPCPQMITQTSRACEEKRGKKGRTKGKKGKGKKKGKWKNKRRAMKQKKKKGKKNKKKEKPIMNLREESLEYIKKAQAYKVHKSTMTETYPGEWDYLYGEIPFPSKKENNSDIFNGDPFTLLTTILNDLADEGYVSASWPFIEKHPDIEQLIKYLQGKLLSKKEKSNMHVLLKEKWARLKVNEKFPLLELGISPEKTFKATWNDKRWITKLAESKHINFYFKVAKTRADYAKKFYNTLCQNFIVTARFMKIFHAYMVSKFEDARLKGPDGVYT